MFSSTSSSDLPSIALVPRVVAFTTILFGLYWCFFQLTGWRAFFAETNLNAGLLRMQSLANSRGPSAIIAGSSITAKLNPELIFEQFEGDSINMGIDGGSTIFAALKILESNSLTKIVLLEANTVLIPPSNNAQILDGFANSVSFKMAEFFPLFRREYRPVTVLYSRLKVIKDEMSFKRQSDIDFDVSKIRIEHPSQQEAFNQEEAGMGDKWSQIIIRLQQTGVSVVLIMIPDSMHDRHKEYVFSRKLAAKHELPFIDLKGQLPSSGLSYSDGTHLIHRSAQKVSKLMNVLLFENIDSK